MAEIEKAKYEKDLLNAFPKSFINSNNEFIAHLYSNQYFMLSNCETLLDVKCKVLEWFSRPAYKSQPYIQEWMNKRLHKFMLNGINTFLGTNFNFEDMELIYTYLGNACNHNKTIKFIQSGYNLSILRSGDDG